VGGHAEIAEERSIETNEPIVAFEDGVTRVEDAPLILRSRLRLWRITKPEPECGAFGRIGKPAVPFKGSVLFVQEEGSDPGVVGVAEFPRIIFALDGGVEVGGAGEAVFYFGCDGNIGRFERTDGLITKFPGEKSVAERLFFVTAIRCELQEGFALEDLRDLRQRRADFFEFRPAGEGDNETGEFANEMIVRGGAE